MRLTAERGEINVSSLTFGVTALTGVFAAFALTGTGGRVLRNSPDLFVVAIVLVVIGGGFLALSALPATTGGVDFFCAATGLLFTCAGLLVGAAAAKRSSVESERPAVSAELVDDGLHLKAKATAENRSSVSRVVLLVDGLLTLH